MMAARLHSRQHRSTRSTELRCALLLTLAYSGSAAIRAPPGQLGGRTKCASSWDSHIPPGAQRTAARLTNISPLMCEQQSVVAVSRTRRLQQELSAVRELRVTEFVAPELMQKIGRTNFDSPTFKKLFTHETWKKYTGMSPWNRWGGFIRGWGGSSVLRAVFPRVVLIALWSSLVCCLGNRLPMSAAILHLQGTAIGLLLVFRTDSSYRRVAEARALMGKFIVLAREISGGAVAFLDRDVDGEPCETAYTICRYMAIFAWVFKARLRDGEEAHDVMRAVLPEEEAAWLISQRSPVTAIISRMRHKLADQYHAGKLAAHMHYKLEQLLFELYQAIGGCEQLFTSPIPPTMTRHVVRSMALWFLLMPLALIGSMPTLPIVGFTAATAYIFLGIEELGVQVEQPFDILPLWQICHLATRNVEEVVYGVPGAHAAELPPFELLAPVWDSVPLYQFDGGLLAPIWQGGGSD